MGIVAGFDARAFGNETVLGGEVGSPAEGSFGSKLLDGEMVVDEELDKGVAG